MTATRSRYDRLRLSTSSSSLDHDSADSSSLVISPSFAALPAPSSSPSRPRLRRRRPDPAGAAFCHLLFQFCASSTALLLNFLLILLRSIILCPSLGYRIADNVLIFCSILFFSRPRSEGWPHHGRSFFICLCPLSF